MISRSAVLGVRWRTTYRRFRARVGGREGEFVHPLTFPDGAQRVVDFRRWSPLKFCIRIAEELDNIT